MPPPDLSAFHEIYVGLVMRLSDTVAWVTRVPPGAKGQ